MRIFVYGNDGRLTVCRRLLLSAHARGELPLSVCDLHLLPIPSYRFSLSEFSEALNSHRKEEASSTLYVEGAGAGASVQACTAEYAADKHAGAECAVGTHPNTECAAETHGGAESAPTKQATECAACTAARNGSAKDGAFDLIVGYGVPQAFFEFEGVRVLDLEADEAFLRRNARLTALGTVGVLLTEHTRALPELCVGVIGYGRIGRELVDILSYLGCRLVVFSANPKTKEELDAQWISTVLIRWDEEEDKNVNDYLQRDASCEKIDIILNTSPSKFSKKFFDGYEGTVYDLASGEPIPKEVRCTRLPSLPMRMYAQSAGHAVYESVRLSLYEIDRERIR